MGALDVGAFHSESSVDAARIEGKRDLSADWKSVQRCSEAVSQARASVPGESRRSWPKTDLRLLACESGFGCVPYATASDCNRSRQHDR